MAPRSPQIAVARILRILRDDKLIRLTARDMLMVERLVASRSDWDLSLLAHSLASLLATDRDGWQAIHDRVLRLREEPPRIAPPGHVRSPVRYESSQKLQRHTRARDHVSSDTDSNELFETDRPRRTLRSRLVDRLARMRGWNKAAIIAAAILGGLGLWLLGEPEPPPEITPRNIPKQTAPTPPPDETSEDEKPTITFPQFEPERRIPSVFTLRDLDLTDPALWPLVLISLLAMLLGGTWLRLPRKTRAAQEREDDQAVRQADALARDDRGQDAPYHIERAPPFAESAMDDAATLLGRIGRRVTGKALDIETSLDRTSRRGGRFDPAFHPVRRSDPLLILVDIERGAHPYLDGVEWMLTRWRRTGLSFERFDYAHIPHNLRPESGGPAISLAELGRRRAGVAVLLFTRFAHAQGYDSRSTWLRSLAPWPELAIIDLDPRPDREREDAASALHACHRVGISRYPFSKAGLLAAARRLAGDPVAAPAEPELTPLESIERHIRLWATCAAYVPDPVWPQLDAIRRHFPELAGPLPDYSHVQRLLDWVRERHPGQLPEGPDGQRLDIPEAVIRTLIKAQRKADRGKPRDQTIEARARRLLLHQLRGASPTSDYERLQRDFKLAVHEAVLDPEKARTLQARFAGTAVAAELRRVVLQEMAMQADGAAHRAWDPAVAESAGAWAIQTRHIAITSLWRPDWKRRDVALSVVVLLAPVALWLAAAAMAERPRVEDTYVPPVWQLVLPDSPEARFGGLDEPPEGKRLGSGETVEFGDGIEPMRFVALSAGEFTMGSPESEAGREDDEVRHRVQVSAFQIAAHEVTQAQWKAVMGTEPSNCSYGCGDDRPVQNVTWFDAVAYLNALTEQENRGRTEGLTTCYAMDGQDVYWNEGCTGYRLPTEAEWEYAARAGTKSAYGSGNDASKLGEYAWYSENAGDEVHSVGTRLANPWGLHDMHGNIWEWVWDWYGSYPTKALSDYKGHKSGSSRMLRGGSFNGGPRLLRSALRGRDWPVYRDGFLGFRCARGGAQR